MQPVASRLANDSLLYTILFVYATVLVSELHCHNVIWTVLYFLVFCSEATILVCQSVTLTFSGAIFQSKNSVLSRDLIHPKSLLCTPMWTVSRFLNTSGPGGLKTWVELRLRPDTPAGWRLQRKSSAPHEVQKSRLWTALTSLLYVYSLFCNVVCIL